MASFRPPHFYAAADSSSSADPKSLSSMRRLTANSNGHRAPSNPIASAASSSENNSGPSLMRGTPRAVIVLEAWCEKFMEKGPNQKPRSTERIVQDVPPDPLAGAVKNGYKGSHFSTLFRKLFQKGKDAEKPANGLFGSTGARKKK